MHIFQVDLRYRHRVGRIHLKGGPRSSGGLDFVTKYRFWASNNSVYWEPKRVRTGKIQVCVLIKICPTNTYLVGLRFNMN